MNSSKSMNLLAIAHNYREQHKHVLLMTSSLDTRGHKAGEISSRTGLHAPAISISPKDDIVNKVDKWWTKYVGGVKYPNIHLDCILIDECQFLTPTQIKNLGVIVDSCHISVMCFGLKNDFTNHLFAGSRTLLEGADDIREIKQVCHFCNRKATMNLRVHNGNPVYQGKQIKIGGNESYLPVCRFHYYNPNLPGWNLHYDPRFDIR